MTYHLSKIDDSVARHCEITKEKSQWRPIYCTAPTLCELVMLIQIYSVMGTLLYKYSIHNYNFIFFLLYFHHLVNLLAISYVTGEFLPASVASNGNVISVKSNILKNISLQEIVYHPYLTLMLSSPEGA